MGDILDSKGDWKAALDAFKEGYKYDIFLFQQWLMFSPLS